MEALGFHQKTPQLHLLQSQMSVVLDAMAIELATYTGDQFGCDDIKSWKKGMQYWKWSQFVIIFCENRHKWEKV